MVHLDPRMFLIEPDQVRYVNLMLEGQKAITHSKATEWLGDKYKAMALLLMLHGKNLADGYILVFHAKCGKQLGRRTLSEGLGSVATETCWRCGRSVEGQNDLLFELEFVLYEQIQFTEE